MATVNEFGYKYPVKEKGVYVPPDDETTPIVPGQIAEVVLAADRDITQKDAAHMIKDMLYIKEQYPLFVIHYVKIETRQMTVQFSYAPPQYSGISGSTISGSESDPNGARIALVDPISFMAAVILLIAAICIAVEVILSRFDRWLWNPPPPTGDLQIMARNERTKQGITGVKIYVGGTYVGKTSTGGVITVEDLSIGTYIVTGEVLAGYYDPPPVHATVNKNEVAQATLQYFPSDMPPPTEGTITVRTWPITGKVFIDNVPYGAAPVGPIAFPAGKVITVAFSEVEGYITPKPQTATIPYGDNVNVMGTYTQPTPGLEKYLKYALIGGGIILGAALIIPEVIRAAVRRGEK